MIIGMTSPVPAIPTSSVTKFIVCYCYLSRRIVLAVCLLSTNDLLLRDVWLAI